MIVNNPVPTISIERTYKHAKEKVFQAFSQQTAFALWIAPAEEIQTEILEFQFKEGGKYRIAFHIPNGPTLYLGGEYVKISKPNQIVFTWQWEEPDENAGINSLVTVDFTATESGTRLNLTHENLANIAMKERHAAGWSGSLNRLTQYLSPEH